MSGNHHAEHTTKPGNADTLAAIVLAEHLEAIRVRQGMTRKELTRSAGLCIMSTMAALSTCRVQLNTVIAIARALGYDLTLTRIAAPAAKLVRDEGEAP